MAQNTVEIVVKARNLAKAGLKDAVKESKASGEKAGEEFGNGWKRGADGRIRDAKGKFVTAGELAAAGLKEGFDKGSKGLFDGLDRLAGPANKAGIALGEVGIGLAKVGVAGNAMSAALSGGGGAIGALSALAPAALLLPGALLAGAAAMQTFKLATKGFGEAVGAGLSGDMAAFAEATKKMHPEMAKAAATVVSFKPKIDDLKKAVQGKFWDQFSVGLKRAGDTYLPLLTKELPKLSQELGNMAKQAVNASSTPFFTGAVTDILGDTTEMFRHMRSSAADVLTGLVGIGKVGTRYLPNLGDGVAGITNRFKEWVEANSEVGGSIEKMIDRALQGFGDLVGIVKNVGSIVGSVFRGLGGEISNPLARIKELTGQVAEFMKTAAAQDGLRALGETLRVVGEVVGRVVMTALKELMPTLVELAPVAQEVARTLGDLLVNALETLGPIIRGIASVLGEFPGVVGFATVAVVGFVAAVKTMQIVNQVSGWLNAAGTAMGLVGDKAKGADGKVGGFRANLGLIKGLAAAGAIAAVAVELDKVNTAAAGGAENLQGFESDLNNIVGAAGQLASGDFAGIFTDIGSELDEMGRKFASGESAFGKMWGAIKRSMSEPLPPITFNVDDGPGRAQINEFLGTVNRSVGTVNINGNDNPAGFALRTILQEIDAGKGTVRIDGEDMPAQQALSYVIGLINNGAGTVDINGNKVPAGQALSSFLGQANRSRATVGVGANTAGASSSVRSFVNTWNGYTIRMNAVVSSRIGGMAAGGPVKGPGTGTSDTAGLFALSNGEYVATAKQVRNAGGPDGFGRLMAALDRGQARGFAGGGEATPSRPSAGAAMRTASAPSAGPVVTFAGNTSDALATVIMQMIRTGKIQIA